MYYSTSNALVVHIISLQPASCLPEIKFRYICQPHSALKTWPAFAALIALHTFVPTHKNATRLVYAHDQQTCVKTAYDVWRISTISQLTSSTLSWNAHFNRMRMRILSAWEPTASAHTGAVPNRRQTTSTSFERARNVSPACWRPSGVR